MQTGIYKHYKGEFYDVIDTVTHSETQEVLVLYRPMYGEKKLWVRPLDMFVEKVNVDGNLIERFKYSGEEDV